MTAALTFRPAIASDLAGLNELVCRSKASWGYASAQMEAWRAELQIDPAWLDRQWVQLAAQGAQTVGCFAIVYAAGEWRLEHLWVEPAAMGKGVGRALLQAACKTAEACGARTLTVDADPHAAAFYTACGAERIGARPAPIGGEPERVLPVFKLPCHAAQPGLAIRTIAAHEWPLYREVRLRSLEEAPAAFCSTFAAEQALDLGVWSARTYAAAASGKDRPLLAEVDGAAAGLLWAKCDAQDAAIVNVFQVWVAPECRGRGLAAALMGEAIAWARDKDAQAVQLSVTCGDTPAVRLYARMGFEHHGAPQPRANTALTEQALRLALKG